MIWIYRLLFLPLFLFSIPYFLWHMKRRGGYDEDQIHRFGNIPSCGQKKTGVKRIWIQAVSVGEVQALRSLLIEFAKKPNIEIILTTTTSTGYRIAKQNYRDLVKHVFYFPLDFALFNLKSWNRIQPDVCILTEGDLWPEHIHRAKRRKVPLILINARLSDRTLRIYQFLGKLTRHLFRSINLVIATSDENARRFRELGCFAEKVLSVGNLKCDVQIPTILSQDEKKKLACELGMPEPGSETNHTIILGGASTWPGEESVLLRICSRLRKEGLDLRLIITPRHMERREEIRSLLENFEFSYHFRSEGKATKAGQVAITDTTGELTKFLQLCDIVFVGRSFPPHKGGQTPIEAGILKKPIIFGPDMSNFREIAKSLTRHGVADHIENEGELETAIRELCLNANLRKAREEKAEQWLNDNRGATERTLKALESLFQTNPSV